MDGLTWNQWFDLKPAFLGKLNFLGKLSFLGKLRPEWLTRNQIASQ